MHSIEAVPSAPGFLWPASLPAVDDARPKRCIACGRPARLGGRIILHGHGVRAREVVVLPALDAASRRLGECWSRRYRCTACGAVRTVLPRGLVPRHLYSVAAVIVAFVLVVAEPIGEGLTDGQAYVLQGMYSVTGWNDGGPYRWRSLDRWARAARERWWPGHAPLGDLASLVVSFRAHAARDGLAPLVEAGTRSHASWGSAM